MVTERVDLDRVAALDEAATPGPWRVHWVPTCAGAMTAVVRDLHEVDVAKVPETADRRLIAFYRSAAPAMARELREARGKLAGLRARAFATISRDDVIFDVEAAKALVGAVLDATGGDDG